MSADNSQTTSNPPTQSTPSNLAARDPRPKRRSLLEIGILAGVLFAVIVAGVIVATHAQHGQMTGIGVSTPTTGVSIPTVYVGSDDGYLYALDAKTGLERWRYHALVRIKPAIADGMVYVLADVGTANVKSIIALRTSDGSLAWSYLIANYAEPWLAVDNGIVYAGSEGDQRGPNYGPTYLLAVNASSGAEVWRESFAQGLGFPSICDGVLCLTTSDGLYALHATDGSLIWHARVSAPPYSAAVQADQAVYFGSDTTIYALDPIDGHVLWQLVPEQYSGSGPFQIAVADGTVYAAGNRLYALDAQTGAVRWTYRPAQFVPTPPVVADGVVFFREANQYVYAVNASDGQLVWQQQVYDDIMSSIALAHGVVYVSSVTRVFYALRSSDGTVLWTAQAGQVFYSPAVGP